MSKVVLTESHLTYMHIGRKYWDADLSSLLPHQKKQLDPYLAKFGSCVGRGLGVFIWGENSTGKTYVAAAMCKQVWQDFRVSSFCITAAELKEAFIQDRPAEEGGNETVMQRCETVRFLVIDDLAKEYRTASGFAEVKFGALLRQRSRQKLTTSITTNLVLKDFRSVYGDSAAELCKECMTPVRFESVNVRDKVADKIVKFLED